MAPEARSNDAAAILLRTIMSADGRPSRPSRPAERPGPVIREELTRLFTWEERHRRLAARLLIAFGLTLLVLAVGSVLIWAGLQLSEDAGHQRGRRLTAKRADH